jgi:hypothetical protein
VSLPETRIFKWFTIEDIRFTVIFRDDYSPPYIVLECQDCCAWRKIYPADMDWRSFIPDARKHAFDRKRALDD